MPSFKPPVLEVLKCWACLYDNVANKNTTLILEIIAVFLLAASSKRQAQHFKTSKTGGLYMKARHIGSRSIMESVAEIECKRREPNCGVQGISSEIFL